MLRSDFSVELRGNGWATDYAGHLLCLLGAQPLRTPGLTNMHPAVAFARSGLMVLTGCPDEPPQLCIAPLASCADGALKALVALATSGGSSGGLGGMQGPSLLAERAAIAGFKREGRISPGGSCRLLDSLDGPIALNLARDDDWTLLPAWLGSAEGAADWSAVACEVAKQSADELIDRGRLLGLAVTGALSPPVDAPPWQTLLSIHDARPGPAVAPLVIDLSALWAGPLCGHLLQRLGARVIKVESSQRPDGARLGHRAFFDLLNAGKASVALDLHSPLGREQLRRLLLKADIVIESSRPRALRQLGIRAEEMIAANPRLSWIAISGYGRSETQGNWIAYGDDAGIAAGLTRLMQETTGQPLIVGDAIADPLTGLHAALVAWASHLCGGGRLIGLSLCDVVRHCLAFGLPHSVTERRARHAEWSEVLLKASVTPIAAHARTAEGAARPLGADTFALLCELGVPC